jgi:hypothetical protein
MRILLRIRNVLLDPVLSQGFMRKIIKNYSRIICLSIENPVFRIRKFLGLPDPDPLVRGTDPDPDSPIIK